jgi:hypothetical protein
LEKNFSVHTTYQFLSPVSDAECEEKKTKFTMFTFSHSPVSDA